MTTLQKPKGGFARRRAAIVLAFYAGLAFLALNILALNAASHVLGPASDFPHFHWNFWWARHALFELEQSVFFTDYVHVPFDQNLAYHTLTLSWLPFYIVVEPLAGQILTINLIIWLSLVLTGSLSYAFFRAERVGHGMALLAGSILMTTPYMVYHLNAHHLNLIALFWLPLTALLWRRVVDSLAWRWAVALGLAFWAMWLTGTQWLLWTPFFLAPYGLMTLIQAKSQSTRGRLVLLGFVAVAVMLALAYGVGPWRQMLQFDAPVQGLDYEAARYWSLPVAALWGESAPRDQSIGAWGLLSAGVVLALLLGRGERWRWLWLVVMALALVLAFGPDIKISAHVIALPYRALHDALGGLYRAPVRFLPVAILAALLFIAKSFSRWWAQRGKWRLLMAGALLVLVMAENRVFVPMQIYEPPHFNFYERIGQDKADVVVLEVPISVVNGWNAVGKYWPLEQFYGITHQKPMVSGFVARENSNNYLYYQLSPLWLWLAGGSDLDLEAARRLFDEPLTAWPIGYIVVDQSHFGPQHPRTLEWLAFFNSHPATCRFAREGARVVYITTAHPAGCEDAPRSVVDLGTEEDLTVFGFGWWWQEGLSGQSMRWMSQEATLHFSPTLGANTLHFRAVAFQRVRQLEVLADGQSVGVVQVPHDQSWQDFALPLPPGTDFRSLTLVADSSDSPQDLGLSGDPRQLSIAVAAVWLDKAE